MASTSAQHSDLWETISVDEATSISNLLEIIEVMLDEFRYDTIKKAGEFNSSDVLVHNNTCSNPYTKEDLKEMEAAFLTRWSVLPKTIEQWQAYEKELREFVCGFVLLWTLTLISMDRHRCIVVPPYRSSLTPRLATLLTVATWALAVILFLPVAFWFHEDPSLQICTLVFPRTQTINVSICFTITAIFFTCILPMALLVYHYQRIFHKLIKTRSRWMTTANISHTVEAERIGASKKLYLQQIVYPARPSSLTHHEEMRLNKHIRVVRVLLLNVVVVLIMWLPITAVMFLIYVDGRRSTEDTEFFLSSHHLIWALLIAYLNTLVNPVLYGLMSENFRAYLSRMWFGSRRCRREPTTTQENSRANRTVSRQEAVPHQETRKSTFCYNLSWSGSRRDFTKAQECHRYCHSYPGSSVSIADVPSTAAILKL